MLRRAAVPALCLAVAGCGLMGPPKTGPHGLTSYDGELRRLSTLQRFDQALAVAEEQAGDAGDELLAALNLAVLEHYAGRYEASNEHLQAADLEIEERYTKSVSRAALSILTNDRALAWLPSRAERPMIHVYGALNYLALRQPDGAAVEARRLSRLLDGMVDEAGVEELDAETRRLTRSLRYFAGAVFEQAGERNDADVAYRLAGVDPDSLAPGVVVLVESGFVAHRVEHAVHLLVGVGELDDLRYGTEGRRLRYARCFSQRRLDRAMRAWDGRHDDWCEGVHYSSRDRRPKDDDVAYLMRVAWPTMYRPLSAAPVGPVRAFAADSAGVPLLTAARAATALEETALEETAARADAADAADEPAGPEPFAAGARAVFTADLSGAVVADFNRQAPEMLVKTVARAAVKYAVVQTLENEVREGDETLADVAAVVGNVFTALTERADTRSWTLLPAQLQLVRLELPPGTHAVRVAAAGRDVRAFDLGPVSVRPAGVRVVAARAWP